MKQDRLLSLTPLFFKMTTCPPFWVGSPEVWWRFAKGFPPRPGVVDSFFAACRAALGLAFLTAGQANVKYTFSLFF